MNEKIKDIRNPLTTIGVFAGLAEISGTIVLPMISGPLQETFVWFLMLFPAFLVSLFFLTLNFNSKVLYSPSDFRDEGNYMKMFQPISAAQKIRKLQEESAELSGEVEPKQDGQLSTDGAQSTGALRSTFEFMSGDPRLRYSIVEGLVIDRLARELNCQPQRDQSYRFGSRAYVFDAVFERSGGLTLVEVKMVTQPEVFSLVVRRTLQLIKKAFDSMPISVREKSRIIFAVAYDFDEKENVNLWQQWEDRVKNLDLPIEIKKYAVTDLLSDID